MYVAPFKRMTTLDASPAVRLGPAEAERQARLLQIPREPLPKQPIPAAEQSSRGEPRRR